MTPIAADSPSPSSVFGPLSRRWDFVIIGGGIVGLAIADRLQRGLSGARVLVLEKEQTVAAHQSGRNSGVLHSGLYYEPGSLKARLAREGNRRMRAFCDAEGIPYRITGKVIVARRDDELRALEILERRAEANGVEVAWLDPLALRRREPHVKGAAALWVPQAGVVDFRTVAGRLADRIRSAGGSIQLGVRVEGGRASTRRVSIETSRGTLEADRVVACAGLHADRVARCFGLHPRARLLPFRGEYGRIRPAAQDLCRGLIYPVPRPGLPFLGVHLTRTIDDRVECGPNAVPALAREGYRATRAELSTLADWVGFRGARRFLRRYWRTGIEEVWRSVNRRAFLRSIQRLVPAVGPDDLEPARPGVRAQAVLPDGTMSNDFLITASARTVHLLNAPSPAATASLAIAEWVVDRYLP